MKFKKPLSLLLAAVLLCAFAVPLLETPALAADKEIHEVATAGVYKWITITAGEGGAVTEVVQTGGVLPPGMSLGKNEDVSSLFGTPTTPGTYILTGETHYEDDAASWVLRWKVRLFVDFAAYPDANADNGADDGSHNGSDNSSDDGPNDRHNDRADEYSGADCRSADHYKAADEGDCGGRRQRNVCGKRHRLGVVRVALSESRRQDRGHFRRDRR